MVLPGTSTATQLVQHFQCNLQVRAVGAPMEASSSACRCEKRAARVLGTFAVAPCGFGQALSP